MYYRFTNSNSPMSAYGHAMFVEDDRDSVDHYGCNEYHYDGHEGVKIEDLYGAITEAWEGQEDWEKPDYYNQFGAEDVCAMYTPDDIVDSANAWDEGDLMQWIWEHVLEPMDIYAVITPDGAIVFDEALITQVAN